MELVFYFANYISLICTQRVTFTHPKNEGASTLRRHLIRTHNLGPDRASANDPHGTTYEDKKRRKPIKADGLKKHVLNLVAKQNLSFKVVESVELRNLVQYCS